MIGMAKYDVFICYRRKDFHLAQSIMLSLVNRGYRVFIDKEGIGNGPFPEAIATAIRESTDFVALVNDASLQRSIDIAGGKAEREADGNMPDDWLAEEVSIALHTGSNIIPVAPVGFAFPDKLPRHVNELSKYTCVFYNSHDLFDSVFIDKLSKRIKSKPQKKYKKPLLTAAIVLVIALLAFAGYMALRPSAAPPEDYAFYVYQDNQSASNHYVDITYMGSDRNGDDGSLAINTRSTDSPKSGDTCVEIQYTPATSDHWAGAMWLSGKDNLPPNPPANGVDTAKVSRLTFWARGTGATKFFIENDRGDQASQYVKLSSQWTQYTLDIPIAWDVICVGFGFASNAGDADNAPMTIWVDDILFE